MATIYLGISGFSYPEWLGTFYPTDLPAAAMLSFYAARFPTVELNNSFYRLPTPAMIDRWRETVPDGFKFSVKARRTITAGTTNQQELLEKFATLLLPLGPKLGPVLFQFPVNAELAQLETFEAALRATPYAATLRPIIEVRNPKLWGAPLFEWSVAHGLALCFNDRFALPETWPEPHNGLAYLRLRNGPYSPAQIAKWAAQFGFWRNQGVDCYVYLRHEQSAPELAQLFFEQLR